MPRSKTPSVAQELAELRQAVARLTEIVNVLVDSIDALTDELQWRNNQLRNGYRHVTVLTSMPKDPCAKDWQINRLRPEDLPPEPPTAAPQQPTLFE